jgi:hypothetical protein
VYFVKTKPLTTDLKIDWSTFEKREDDEVAGWTYYVNRNQGLIISVYHGAVSEYEFVPPEKNSNLRCPKDDLD